MLNLTYSYRIYPRLDQEAQMLDGVEQCPRVYDDALAERKDWINSRKCLVNACSIRQEYIITCGRTLPRLLQTAKCLENTLCTQRQQQPFV